MRAKASAGKRLVGTRRKFATGVHNCKKTNDVACIMGVFGKYFTYAQTRVFIMIHVFFNENSPASQLNNVNK